MFALSNVLEASEVLDPIIRHTPCIKTRNCVSDFELIVKAENLQVTGAFKIRGAYYRISKLTDEQKEKGIIAASAGNHAQGVAFAAKSMGIKATIVMPKTAPLAKVEATRLYGVNVVLQGDNFDEAYAYSRALQQETSATFIEPFNDEILIAGQGTIGLEIINDVKDVDTVIVPIGGGGLISGIAATIKTMKPACRIIGVEAANASSMLDSINDHEIITLASANTLADGIAVRTPGSITYQYCKNYVDEILTVTEDEIASTILLLMEKEKMVVEGAGAVSVAAAIYYAERFKGKKVVAVTSGGNIDVTLLSRIIDKGLIKSGRKITIGTILPDKPGQLTKLLDLISKLGANIVNITHSRSHHYATVQTCYVELSLETSDQQHINTICGALKEEGYFFMIEN